MDHRCGFIAVIGPSNAGKSTLTNALVGQKVAIVTHKVQTTRMRIRAVMIHETAQIILVDTPGIFSGQRKFDKIMVKEAWDSVRDADAIAVILDAGGDNSKELDLIIKNLRHVKKPIILVLNKVDLVQPKLLLSLSKALNERINFHATFMVSALKGTGFKELLSCMSALVPSGIWLYPEDIVLDAPFVILAAEITREQLFFRLHQELPYALTVETEKWERKKDGSVRIEQVIYVRRSSQKMIILGKSGQNIKAIGQQARHEMEKIFGHKVHLFLFVKVCNHWMNDPERYRMMGIQTS